MLATILTPEEIDEYELRMSETAERLRAGLVGFNPTEEEFREIFRLQRQFDEKFAHAGSDGEAAKVAEQEQLDQEIKSKLEPERLADYERTKSKDYQDMCFFAQKHELPLHIAQTIYDYKQVSERERARVMADKQLSDETKLEALRAIEATTLDDGLGGAAVRLLEALRTDDEARILGSIARGTSKIVSSSSSQSSVLRFISIVRLALVTSVAWMPPCRPPVRCQMTHVSGLPNTASPRSAASRTPGTFWRIHWIFAPEKYVAGGNPVFARIACA